MKQKVSRRGCQKPVKTQSFKKVLGLKVSRQGKLEFESDLSKMLIKQNNQNIDILANNSALAAGSPSQFSKGL